MIALIWFVLAVLASTFKSKSRLEAENAVLQHQLIVCGASCVAVSNSQTAIAGSLSSYITRRFPSILQVLTIVRLDRRNPRLDQCGMMPHNT
jgi:hypothetical protein